jgi:hypothetical protein
MTCTGPIPLSANHCVHPLISDPSQAITTIPTHLTPLEHLHWGPPDKLERITLYVSPSGTTLHGLRVQFIQRFWAPKRYAGMRRNIGEEEDPPAWPEDRVVPFDIDGPGGERVSEVAVGVGLGGGGGALAFKVSKQAILRSQLSRCFSVCLCAELLANRCDGG